MADGCASRNRKEKKERREHSLWYSGFKFGFSRMDTSPGKRALISALQAFPAFPKWAQGLWEFHWDLKLTREPYSFQRARSLAYSLYSTHYKILICSAPVTTHNTHTLTKRVEPCRHT